LRFQRQDAAIFSDAFPAFFVGQNMEGFWVVREENGQIGGVFLCKESAFAFARQHSRPAGCAIVFPSETIELDVEK